MALVSVLVGSPVGSSVAAGLGSYVQSKLEGTGHTVVMLDASTIAASSLIGGDSSDPDVVEMVGLIEASDGVVITTPIQTNSYSGVLKALLDVLPADAFAEKALVPLATGGSNFHVSALEYALVPVLRNLGARQIVSGAYVLDRDVVFHPCDVSLAPEAEFAVDSVIDSFESALDAPAAAASDDQDWTRSVSAQRALTLYRSGALLLDVRSNAQDPDSGFVDGAMVVPKSDIEDRFGQESDGRLSARFDPSEPILVFCNGALGSRPVALRLEALGYTSVRQVRGGFKALVAEQSRGHRPRAFHTGP
ncbi:NAD(P)H-dependent oxidoreductase [Rhodococcoides yunnanense]|uniref:NAD(P)H-dependent oxidoreductase n=1 Tax=Rhodococcoides yunnanense TaxID=278209 RepID=UPI0014729251|nr:NAD(P)H-dependent oxidoreductase [Rhodococcus yunnanensis]